MSAGDDFFLGLRLTARLKFAIPEWNPPFKKSGSAPGMGKEAVSFYRCFAELLSKRNTMTYSSTLAWLHVCLLSFSLLRSATMCIRGSRSISYRSSDVSPELGLISIFRDF